MIISGIIGFMLWPAIILVSYYLIKLALKRYEKKLEE
jgi:hypothetical protein